MVAVSPAAPKTAARAAAEEALLDAAERRSPVTALGVLRGSATGIRGL